jgi:hypothetical protein
MDKGVTQKRADCETDEESCQPAHTRFVHRDRQNADKRNKAHSANTGKGKNDGPHTIASLMRLELPAMQ